MYVIAGVSGQTGSVAASTLLGDRRPVRVIVRDQAKGAPWKARGAQVAVASLDDRAALASALTGADGAYLLLPPTAFDEDRYPAGRRRCIEAVAVAVETRARPPGSAVVDRRRAHLGDRTIAYLHARGQAARQRGAVHLPARGVLHGELGAMTRARFEGGALHLRRPDDLRFAQVATPDIGRTAAHLLFEGPRAGLASSSGRPHRLTLGETAAPSAAPPASRSDAVSIPTTP